MACVIYPDFGSRVGGISAQGPTGILFRLRAEFPKNVSKACSFADWSYGNLHAVTFEPKTCVRTRDNPEIFRTAAPLPINRHGDPSGQ